MFVMGEVVALLHEMLAGRCADVLLVDPPLGLGCGVQEDPIHISPPVGLGYLSTIADRAGLGSAVIEAEMLGLGVQQVVELLELFSPRVVGFGINTPGLSVVRAIVDAMPTPRPLLVAGGIHATVMPQHTIDSLCALDLLVRGEAEEVWEVLCRYSFDVEQAVSELGRYADISRCGRTVVLTVRQPPAMESIPELDHRKFAKVRLLLDKPKFEFTVLGSRGCTFRCRFCASAAFRRHRVQYRSTASLVHEIEGCVQMGGRAFHLIDDNTLGARRRVLEFSGELATRRLPVRWRTFSRADQLDPEVAAALRDAGCRQLTFGIESGSQSTLARMNKDMKVESAVQAADICRRYGIRSKGFFILGYPGDTEKDFLATIELARVARFDAVQFNLARAFPGTALFDELVSSGYEVADLLTYKNIRATAPDGTPSTEQKTQYCVVNGPSICPPYSHADLARWVGLAYHAVSAAADASGKVT